MDVDDLIHIHLRIVSLSPQLSNFLFFFFRAAIVERLNQRNVSRLGIDTKGKGPPPLTPRQDLATGALAGVCSRALTTPLSNITVRKQTHSSSSSSSASKGGEKSSTATTTTADDSDSDDEQTYEDEPSIWDVVNEIVKDKGVVGE